MSRKYPVVSTVTLADQALIWSATNSMWALTSFSTILNLIQENIETPTVQTQYNSPQATGFSVDIGLNIDNGEDIHLILTPASGYATGTLVLPIVSSLKDKQTVLVTNTNDVTSITIDGNGATNVIGEPFSLPLNYFFKLKYDMTMSTWYRVG